MSLICGRFVIFYFLLQIASSEECAFSCYLGDVLIASK